MSNINRISSLDNISKYSSSAGKLNSESEFSSYLGETKRLDTIFDEAAKKYNVPVELLKAIGKAESNFDANAVSRCGAQGIMQLMPATAKGLGVMNAFDPEQNIMGGAKYIAGLVKKYDGNTGLALAAYNAGSGNVAKYEGIPPFKETQNYVKKVLNYMGQGGIEITSSDVSGTRGNPSGVPINLVPAANLPAPVFHNLSYVLTGSTSGTADSRDDLENVFTYDEYLKFLDKFLEEEKDAGEEKNAKSSSENSNFNSPMLNVLLNQKLI